MYKLAFDIIHNHHDAEDVVHDVIVKVINNADYFESNNKDDLKKLIVIATRNQAINKYNENKRRDEATVSTTQINCNGERYEKDIPDNTQEIESIELSDENLNTLKQLIDKLDHKYRDVFILMGQGFNNKQIADIMGISVDNVRQRFYRGKMKIIEQGGDMLYGIK